MLIHPIERLVLEGWPIVDADEAAALSDDGPAVLFVTGPVFDPEAEDVAITARDLARRFPDVSFAIVGRGAEDEVRARLGLAAVPALALTRRGGTLAAVLPHVQPWLLCHEAVAAIARDGEACCP